MMLEVNMGMGLELGLTAGLGMVLDMVLQKKKRTCSGDSIYTRIYSPRNREANALCAHRAAAQW